MSKLIAVAFLAAAFAGPAGAAAGGCHHVEGTFVAYAGEHCLANR